MCYSSIFAAVYIFVAIFFRAKFIIGLHYLQWNLPPLRCNSLVDMIAQITQIL